VSVAASENYRATLVWSGANGAGRDSLVWAGRSLSWARGVPVPDILGETLTVQEDRGRHLTVMGGQRR